MGLTSDSLTQLETLDPPFLQNLIKVSTNAGMPQNNHNTIIFSRFPISGNDQSQVSHPPHLESSWSSAFIPFCAYKTKLNFSENSPALNGTNFPLCTSFVPTILEGQYCYNIAVSKDSGTGKENELMLLLDYNEDRSLQVSSNTSNMTISSNKTHNFGTAVASIQGASAKVQINTLSPYTGFGGGIYKMTDVKRMIAKEDFFKMSFKDRNCEVELYEDCKTRRLLERCMQLCSLEAVWVSGKYSAKGLLCRSHLTRTWDCVT